MKPKTYRQIVEWINSVAMPCPHETETQQRSFRYVEREQLIDFLDELIMAEYKNA